MKKSNIPMRKCVGCNESKPQNDMTRIACYEGTLTIDYIGKAKGRGVYLCNDPKCIETARKKRAILRGFKGAVTAEQADEALNCLLTHLEEKTNG